MPSSVPSSLRKPLWRADKPCNLEATWGAQQGGVSSWGGLRGEEPRSQEQAGRRCHLQAGNLAGDGVGRAWGFWEGDLSWSQWTALLSSLMKKEGSRKSKTNTWGAAWWGWTLGKGVGTVPTSAGDDQLVHTPQDSSGPALRVLFPRGPSVTHPHPCPCSPPTDPNSGQRVPGDELGTPTRWERGRAKVHPPPGYFVS